MDRELKDVIATVQRVIFYNTSSKWGVVTVKNPFADSDIFKDDTIILTGNFETLYEGCSVKFSGDVKTHPKYGLQIALSSLVVCRDLTTKESIISFLTKSDIRGISIQNAKKIYEAFKDDSISIVLDDPDKLMSVKGIGAITIQEVKDSVAEYKSMRELIDFGTSIGLSYGVMYRLFNILGEDTVKIIKTDIYSVVEATDSIPFKQIDNVALQIGYAPDHPKRLRACLIYCLKTRVMMNSSTGCYTNDLKADFSKIIGETNYDLYQPTLNSLMDEGVIVAEGAKVFYKKYYNKEDFIAHVLLDLKATPFDTSKIDKDIVEYAINSFNFELNDQQVNAITGIVQSRVSVLTGGPGTGKSTITKALVDIYKNCGFDVQLLAPTGKATRRMEECTGRKAMTIHKFLGATYTLDDILLPVVSNNTVFIIDECSMLDILLLDKLCQIASTTPVIMIFVGDKDQLPSVQAGNVLADLIDTKVIDVFQLNDIMRQAENSHIIKFCSDINKGIPIPECQYDDFVYEMNYSLDDVIDTLTKKYKDEVLHHDLQEVQVISAYKQGTLGVNNLNRVLSEVINGDNPINEKTGFRQNDKVICINNNYKKDVFNGETGTLVSVQDSRVIANMNDVLKEYSITELGDLQLAYATTCHKSQGSEYSVVFVIIDDSISNFLLTRKLLYTAVSRGKKKVYIYATDSCMKSCIDNTFETPRITKLGEFLTTYCRVKHRSVEDWKVLRRKLTRH